jgi:RNase P subunit RPR2
MSAEQVTVIPLCEGCRKVWLPGDKERWQRIGSTTARRALVFSCPGCAEREFDVI